MALRAALDTGRQVSLPVIGRGIQSTDHMPQDFVASAIIRAARQTQSYPRLRVLDLSCGRGEILSALAQDGCRVRGTHYRHDDYKLTDQSKPTVLSGLDIDQDVDLLQPLPYEDSSFDLVILSEVIEHLPTYIPIIREVGRILDSGGLLILSTPNIGRLHSRWHFFWSGTHKLIRRRVGWDLAPDDLYAYHISPVEFPLLHTILWQSRLRVRALRFTRFKIEHAWLLIAYPFVWLTTAYETRHHITGDLHRRGEKDLFRWLLHPAMLASEQLLLVAQKLGQT
jgi:SAM-dependent methyltransferase